MTPWQPDLETALHLLGSEHEDEVERGARIVLEQADTAHPRLLELLESGESNFGVVAALLAEIGRPQSVPALERELETAWAARFEVVLALARHPADEARLALERALAHPDPAVVGSAALGLEMREEPASCAALRRRLDHADSGARFRAIRAAIRLGCLDEEELAAIADGDESEDARRVALEALAPAAGSGGDG